VRDKADGLLADEAPIHELDELRGLIVEGQERGFLTIEEITTCLEEVEVTKEQIAELHGHLVDQGIEIVDANGKPVGVDSAARAEAAAEAPKALKVKADTVETGPQRNGLLERTGLQDAMTSDACLRRER